jgi:LuxR family maltose regulon positive regulatory protein
MNANILATKLHLPFLPPRYVQRPHLVQRLNEGFVSGCQLTFVSAPAGFGKSTCVSEWVTSLDRWPVSWLSLEPSDDDPGRFFSYFVAALQKVDETIGQEIDDVLRSGQLHWKIALKAGWSGYSSLICTGLTVTGND